MPNTIQITVNNVKSPLSKTVTVGSGSTDKPLTLNSEPKALFSILDTQTGHAPQNILVRRDGQNLTIAFQKNAKPDIVIQNFYDQDSAGLVGLAENDEYYYYVPDAGQKSEFIPNLTSEQGVWHALGPVESAAGLPWGWLGLLGLGALAAAGGGGSTVSPNGVAIVPKGTGSLTEDTTTPVSGHITIKDADAGESGAQAGTAEGIHGTFVIDTAGNWSYQLDTTDSTVQALGEGDTMIETFMVKSKDGSASNVVTITINGVNDLADIPDGSGNVVENTTLQATGTIVVIDADTAQSGTQGSDTSGVHGSFTIDTSGNWTYDLNSADTVVEALSAGQTLTESFVVTSTDGLSSSTVTISITGIDDAATLTVNDTNALKWYENIAGAVVNTGVTTISPISHTLDTLGFTIHDVDSASVNGYSLTISLSAGDLGTLKNSSGTTLVSVVLTGIHSQSDLDAALAQYSYQPSRLNPSQGFIPDTGFDVVFEDGTNVTNLSCDKEIYGLNDTLSISTMGSSNYTGEGSDTVTIEAAATNNTLAYTGADNDKIDLLAVNSGVYAGTGNDKIFAESTLHYLVGGLGDDKIYLPSGAHASRICGDISESVNGDSGRDEFWLSSSISDTVGSNINILSDFSTASDNINFFDVIDSNSDSVINLLDVVAAVSYNSSDNWTDITLVDADHDGRSAHIFLDQLNIASIADLSSYVGLVTDASFIFTTI